MGIPVSENAPTIRIYGWWEKPSGQAAAQCTRDQAMAMVQRKRARWRLGGFAVQLRAPKPAAQRKIIESIVVRGRSCQMGPRITEAIVMGNAFESALAEEAAFSYLLILYGSYCPLVSRLVRQ